MAEKTAQNRESRSASEGGEARPTAVGRPPIVVVMGHVDHGKTTLLDYIRKANVAGKEAGGITQSIGAYEIIHTPTDAERTQTNAEKPSSESASSQRKSASSEKRKITFIDTPGHEAFTKMRARGANAADLAILVVASDEGVKPQTEESIKILNETKTPFVVALTKTDKPNADVEKVKQELTTAGVLLEGFGGSISYEAVSAQSGEGVDKLLDLILLSAEMENLTYDPSLPGSGFILEARMDKRRGQEASVIVKNGTLRQGQPIATPNGKGKIKILEDFAGKTAKELVPSAPALVLGWDELPQVGDEFVTGDAANVDLVKKPAAEVTARQSAGLQAAAGDKETLNLVLKAGDNGSLEALSQIINAMAEGKSLKIVSEGIGDVGDNDVNLTISTGSVLIAFKSKIEKGARILAEAQGTRIIASDVIYDLTRSVEEFLAAKDEASSSGELEVLAVFNQQKLDKQVVGGRVTKGVLRNRAQFEIERPSASSPQAISGQAGQGPEIVGKGRVTNLQQQKQDASQVAEGNEAGLMVNSPVAIQVGDKLIIRV